MIFIQYNVLFTTSILYFVHWLHMQISTISVLLFVTFHNTRSIWCCCIRSHVISLTVVIAKTIC